MNFFEQILYNLSGKMEIPVGYGSFHLICFGVIILLTAATCLLFRNVSQRTEKIMLMSTWIVLVLLETYRQLLYSIHFSHPVYWDYDWNAFPFQFCSSPLFFFPLAALPKNERVRDVFRMFFATFSLFAGLAVLFNPDDAFSSYIGISLQTMIHHGAMIVFGVFLGGRLLREGKMKLTLFAKSGAVFACLVLIAFLMNLSAPLFTDEVFNMFYIGPYFPCQLIILCDIYPAVPHPVFLLIYTLGFIVAAFAVFCAQLVLRPAWYKALIAKYKDKSEHNI